MELRHLRYFVAVAEELNFTKAAQRMCTVQPSLSQQIKDLEQEVGVQLLIRSNRKVELTEEGKAFLKEALLSLEHAEKAIQDARKIANLNKDQLNIGFVPVAEMKIFPYIMPNIRAHFPEIQIKKMKRRWGACFYQKNRVCFNLVLAHIDYALIDYVIVHELCHFLEANHSKAFYHEIEKRMPDYKERERLLKDVGI